MNFSNRNSVLSCSGLARIRQCGASWSLSKGVPDDSSEHAEEGNLVHSHLSNIILGKLPNPQSEQENLAWKLWGHMQRAAFSVFGDAELVWKSEGRLWMSSPDLEPILSGQYDALCHLKDKPTEAIIFDAKTGWNAGEVPRSRDNAQMQGLAQLFMQNFGAYPMGSIVREWAADEPMGFTDDDIDWVWHLAMAVHEGQYDVWHKASLRTGPECSFCPAKGNCPAYRDAFQMVVKADDLEKINISLNLLEAPDLVRILRASPMAEKVIEAAKAEAHRRRKAGEELPGVNWVKGNSKRAISNPTGFAYAMMAEGIDLGEFQKTEIPLGSSVKAWLKSKGMKDDAKGKEAFNKTFKEFLSFSENAPSISFE